MNRVDTIVKLFPKAPPDKHKILTYHQVLSSDLSQFIRRRAPAMFAMSKLHYDPEVPCNLFILTSNFQYTLQCEAFRGTSSFFGVFFLVCGRGGNSLTVIPALMGTLSFERSRLSSHIYRARKSSQHNTCAWSREFFNLSAITLYLFSACQLAAWGEGSRNNDYPDC